MNKANKNHGLKCVSTLYTGCYDNLPLSRLCCGELNNKRGWCRYQAAPKTGGHAKHQQNIFSFLSIPLCHSAPFLYFKRQSACTAKLLRFPSWSSSWCLPHTWFSIKTTKAFNSFQIKLSSKSLEFKMRLKNNSRTEFQLDYELNDINHLLSALQQTVSA